MTGQEAPAKLRAVSWQALCVPNVLLGPQYLNAQSPPADQCLGHGLRSPGSRLSERALRRQEKDSWKVLGN